MKKIVVQGADTPPDYETETVAIIIEAMASEGYECSPEQARMLWLEYSDSMCAGWMALPSDKYEDIVACVRPYFLVI